MLQWITDNIGTILSVLAGTHVLAVAIVNLTATPKDDAIVAKVYGVIEKLAGMFTPKVKE